MCGISTNGAQQRQFLCPLAEDDGKRVVDDEDRDKQGDTGKAKQDVADDADALVKVVSNFRLDRGLINNFGAGNGGSDALLDRCPIGGVVKSNNDAVEGLGDTGELSDR